MSELDFITPSWPAPKHVKALSSTRLGGVSEGPYASLNLGDHVNDDSDNVMLNRQAFSASLPAEPMWLNQVHGTTVVQGGSYTGICDADASVSSQLNQVCVVMTADCLPVIFCDISGTQVGAAHAGWRGLLDGVLESTLDTFTDASEVMAWLGPAIGPSAFEVGQEVKDAFCAQNPLNQACFTSSNAIGKWLADLYGLARVRLLSAGIKGVYGGGFCTYTEQGRFFSYRRDGVTGRMATCIWLAD